MTAGVTPIPQCFHPRRPHLVRPVEIDPRGRTGPTRGMAKRERWLRSSHGYYLPWWVDMDEVEQRIVAASMVTQTCGGTITGWAALRWLGGRWFDGLATDGSRLPVMVTGIGIRPQPGIVVTTERLNSSEIIGHDGIPVTVAVRSALFEMRYAADPWQAVVVADMAAYSDLVSIHELWSAAPRHSGMIGIPQARDALMLANENTWSPMETVMRLTWELVAELPRPLMNRPVFDLRGRHLATPDLLDVESGTYGEFNGAFHLDGRRRRRDQEREDLLRRAGLEPFEVLAGQSRDEVAARMVAARDRAMRLGSQRSWTIEQPSWWVPTETVAQRRALSPADRRRLLSHRAR